MFGYVIANRSLLSDEQYQRYRKYYCSLCRSIGERCGQLGRMTLTYDMCFLLMLLDSIYKPESGSGNERCVVRPFKKHEYSNNELIRYCADMNVLLVYYSLLDQWNDERYGAAYAAARLLKKSAGEIGMLYPRQSKLIEANLNELSALEKGGVLNADLPAAAFGRLMAELFAVYEDEYAGALRELGSSLGRLIYIMDACVDFRRDLKRGQYNPLAQMTTDSFEPMLCMLLGDCTDKLKALRLSDEGGNSDILDNILYSGIWTKFNMTYKNKAQNGGETEDE